jgi:hypothetical protein
MLVRAKLSIQEIQKFGKPHIKLVKLPSKLIIHPSHYKPQKLPQAFCCKYRKSVIIFFAENDGIQAPQKGVMIT